MENHWKTLDVYVTFLGKRVVLWLATVLTDTATQVQVPTFSIIFFFNDNR